MKLKEIIERNYNATVSRGLIKPETSKTEFVEKLKEEIREFEFEVDNPFLERTNEWRQNIELADVLLVGFAYAYHFKIDILKIMAEKVMFNEKR